MKKLGLALFIILLLVGLVLGYRRFIGQPDQQPGDTNPTVEQQVATNGEQATDDAKDYREIGLALLANESLGFLRYGLADTDVVGLLGEADEKSECHVGEAGGQKHQIWKYHFKGIELDMVPQGDGLVIHSVKITNPCPLKTLRNIGIGSFKGQVMNAYDFAIDPETVYLDRTILVAGTEHAGMIFRFQNNRVSSIFIGATAVNPTELFQP